VDKIGAASATWYGLLYQAAWQGALRIAADRTGKLVMVQEFDSMVPNTQMTNRNDDIYWQSHAMNVRGIPWVCYPNFSKCFLGKCAEVTLAILGNDSSDRGNDNP